MLNIIIFGASGGSGRCVVEQALALGHRVTVIVRYPAAFTLRNDRLHVVKGDVLLPHTFEHAMAGKDAVLSCLGIQQRIPTTIYSEGTSNILNGMQKQHCGRFICISAQAIIVPPKASWLTKFVTRNILQRIFKYIYADMRTMEKIVSASLPDWTIIRAPWLRNTRHTGHYRVTINEHLDNPSKVSRADLADFMLHIISDKNTFRAIAEISY